MRKYLFILVLIVCNLGVSSESYSQIKPPPVLNDPDYDFEKLLRFGFSLGINFMDFQIKSNPNFQENDSIFFVDNSVLYPGFNVNVVSDLRITPTVRLRFLPGLAFGQRDLYFYPKDGGEPTIMPIESSFIELPLMIKYAADRKWNARPYVIAGANFRIDMAAYKKLNIEENVYIGLRKGGFYYEFGFGYEFFLTWFKFSTELKFSSAFGNALGRYDDTEGAAYYNAIDMLKSQLVTLSFHFE
ncbi:MAG: porin family protein [Bacteroidales bacterium]|nr:porin family protein [Bacteroidales bacterium]MDD4672301.1 porin family protein [Bacteroidales bacterium]MDY0347400.1 porin family protein [Tenuifilaceae bacterium]